MSNLKDMIMEQVEKYIGKWYTFKGCEAKVIILVTGYDNSNEKYKGSHFVGKKTTIFSTGLSMNEDWACEEKAFFGNIKHKFYKPFNF